MLAPTHSAFGIFLTLIILAVFGIQFSLHWSVILFAIIGAILPDIDHPKSVIGKVFYVISKPMERNFGHRQITHSFLGWGIATVGLGVILAAASFLGFRNISSGLINWRWISAFSISYLSHLILDMFNKSGVPLFWPDPSRDVIPRNPKFRFESGGKAEPLIFMILVLLVFLALPLSKYGLASSLRWLLATPGSAIQEFKSLKTHSFLEFTGQFQNTKEDVEGSAEILDVDRARLVILFDDEVYTLSDELSADIAARKVRVKRTTKPTIVEKKEFSELTFSQMLSTIPRNALVSGRITLPRDLKLELPAAKGEYKRLEQKGNELILNFATRDMMDRITFSESYEFERKKDIAELQNLQAQVIKLKGRIAEAESAEGLTPLGKEMLLGQKELEEQKAEIEELKSRLASTQVKIEELNLKIKERRLVFSGEVYIRR